MRPARGWAAFRDEAVVPGSIVSAFATRRQYEAVAPPGALRFVVVRDLRDTLVSAYFSFRDTHPENPAVDELRRELRSRSLEDGLLLLMEDFLPRCARIQDSWQREALRYETLAEQPEILATILRAMGLRVPRIDARPSTTRWQEHFTERVSDRFEQEFSELGFRRKAKPAGRGEDRSVTQ